LGAPAPIRLALAALISTTRAPSAQKNYAMMGGGSPLLPETEKQAAALRHRLRSDLPSQEVEVFIAMRYWRPLTEKTAKDVAAFAPDDVVLLPLYPQFSVTTTGSSLRAWSTAYNGGGAVHTVCCYPAARSFVSAHAAQIHKTWAAAGSPLGVRLLFSAHGLPERVIKSGDPYQAQVERTAAGVMEVLGKDWDCSICYQSKVGPLTWIGPSTPSEICRAAADGKGVLLCPIAFVSEHVETLVELDHEYADLAAEVGVTTYLRAPALGVVDGFIETLVEATKSALNTKGVAPFGCSPCQGCYSKCPAQGSCA
jgi:ferrochelatase